MSNSQGSTIPLKHLAWQVYKGLISCCWLVVTVNNSENSPFYAVFHDLFQNAITVILEVGFQFGCVFDGFLALQTIAEVGDVAVW